MSGPATRHSGEEATPRASLLPHPGGHRKQPPDGFETLADAGAALAEADPAAELERARGQDAESTSG